ncbi:BrnT family toxin [Lamprobacter modestohalophilus]|uniref:BrnT family toxin n=1 Tax=Lamprobacter modestohalophilus TaxID=1064514 RepID=UPI001908306C
MREDTREAYGEQRWIGFAPIGRAVYCVVFTEERELYRIISLHKATPKEIRDYARYIEIRPDF